MTTFLLCAILGCVGARIAWVRGWRTGFKFAEKCVFVELNRGVHAPDAKYCQTCGHKLSSDGMLLNRYLEREARRASEKAKEN